MTVKAAVDPLARKNEEESPPWLRNLVKLGQFYRYCESHPSNVCNLYCISCMGVPICLKCKNQHTECGRKILTAYKASREATLRTEDVKSIWDISDICFYIINRKQIVFIRRKGRGGHPRFSHGDERCRNCSYRIRPRSNYCSIECKVDFIQRGQEASANKAGKRKSIDEADAGTPSAGIIREPGKPKSYRKRPRKGIPCRSPFY